MSVVRKFKERFIMLSENYKIPMQAIRDEIENKDLTRAFELHKELLAKSGMWGFYYGSPLFNKVEGEINGK